jgi:hypothetical protein
MPTIRINLPSGLTMSDAWMLLADMRERVGWYTAYDAKPVANNDSLTRDEMWISRGLGSRLSNREADALSRVRRQIEDSLKAIPSEVDLADLRRNEAIPGLAAIVAAIECMCRVKGVKVSKATKILHKKRPNLIPVLDQRVGLYYAARLKNPKFDLEINDLSDMIEAFRRDLDAVNGEIRELKRQLDSLSVCLTPTRILDHLIWARLSPANFE